MLQTKILLYSGLVTKSFLFWTVEILYFSSKVNHACFKSIAFNSNADRLRETKLE